MMFDISMLVQHREGNRLEAKKAEKSLPRTFGKPTPHLQTQMGARCFSVSRSYPTNLSVVGTISPEKLVSEFWNTLNNPGQPHTKTNARVSHNK